MRRLSLLGTLLLLTACSSGGEEPVPETPSSSTTPILLETDAPSPDPVAPVAGDHRLAVTLPDGAERDYLLHAPPGVERGRPVPLVLVFHGTPGSPEEMVRITRFDGLADEEGFLVVYPSSFPADDVGPLLDHLAGLWPIDESRVYAAGFSRGASTTYRLADVLAGRIAAFAPISGLEYDARPDRPASLITVQGAEDDFAPEWPAVNRSWARAAGCGTAESAAVRFAARPALRSVAQCRGGSEHVVYGVERMGHTWPRQATRLVWEFFMAHPLHR